MPLYLPYGRRLNIINIVGDDYPTGPLDGFPTSLGARYKGGWIHFRRGRVVLSLCGPARGCGMTGRLPQHHRMLTNDTGADFDWTRTYFCDLARAGYINFVTGKLMNGYGEPGGNTGAFEIALPFPQIGIHKAKIMHCPPRYALLADTGITYIDETGAITGSQTLDVGDAFYYPDRWKTFVEDFITSMLPTPGVPWSVYVGDKASHTPITPASRYAATSISFTDNAAFGVDPVATGQPQFIIDQADTGWNQTKIDAAHATKLDRLRTLRATDDSTKHVIDFLDTNGLLPKTALFFRCDQTDFSGEERLDGGKGTQLKPSNFMEFFVRCPVAAGSPNFECDLSVNDMDVACTIRKICGAASHYMEDGMSLDQIMLNPAITSFREASPYFNPIKNPECEGLNFENGVTWGRGVAGTDIAGQEYNYTDEWCTVNTGPNAVNAAKLNRVKAIYGFTP